ncbi:16S rRNA (cytidine(1402)-2'-O)-methyltransferase [Candidatus Puniceispirillum marinum]|uniref:Ribosomal RNA small subunit methyltransferase I n=1 Tax=Puniceispirillum marinum (strain IMCC1322) TaxID=488538 RepID=D5BUC0_PUNMI|nr:16S rRNA (cytidine(1402)-2'-O)-methyltransferase [Candidatus Puniceispirillum marinum]ADE39867.1 Uroporphyrin-III C/tetrapyrrole (Corrin/Porphyrin) methyltransferase [Candidatus Puniceispirillum marinum IMCC1322]
MRDDYGLLSVVATPIGNLGDFSPRAAACLETADIIACEDTRMTRKLLTLTGISSVARLYAYHDHNGHTMRPKLIKQLLAGKNIALVSDAGTPLISDPGFKLVAACHDHNITVTSIPGPSAPITALAAAGLPTDKFMFAGFIPATPKAARDALTEVASLTFTTIWFATPKRLSATLHMMRDIFGDRLAVVARELTKMHEHIHRGTLTELCNHYDTTDTPKGELVILVEGRKKDESLFDDVTIEQMLRAELEGASVRDAVQAITDITGQPRKKIYKLAIDIQE